MNWVDILIILLLISAILRGLQAGWLQLFLSSIGFIGGLLGGSLAAKYLAEQFSSPTVKLMTIITLEFGLALLLFGLGEILAHKLKPHALRLRLGKLNEIGGGVLEVFFTLTVVWLVASALVNVHSYGIGHDVRRSFIIKKLNTALPRPPDIFAQLEKIISPNGFPNVFLGLEPQHTSVSPKNSVDNQAILAAEDSIVKVQGAGCGGLVFGTGFVTAPNLVVTNAHVVAGIKNPQVVDKFKTYQATAVWFDPNLDIAVLRVKNLPDQPLTLSEDILPDADAVAVLGFPHGGALVAENAAIIDHVRAVGRNIYNKGVTQRDIYEVQADIQQGDSGGPLLAPDGTVAGVIFAKSVSQNGIGYALLTNQVEPIIPQAAQKTNPVSTGSCTQR
ncbi:MarP family serine protease [Candidatus Saccharibacteria bacterium]|nr:MarP family serine protease [Candidatus Saccharibacteria bacterium]